MNLHINQHKLKLHVGSYIFIENFGVVSKVDKVFEKGAMSFVWKVLSTCVRISLKGVKMSSFINPITTIVLLSFKNTYMSNGH